MHGAGIGATHRRRGWIVADLMQQAREILAKEFPLSDPRRAALLRGGTVLDLQYGLALRAVVIALRTAPEGFVLVPVERGQLYVCPTCHGPGVVTKAVHDATRAARPHGVKDA